MPAKSLFDALLPEIVLLLEQARRMPLPLFDALLSSIILLLLEDHRVMP